MLKIIRRFGRAQYETMMCFVAMLIFSVPAVKLLMALLFNYWNEYIWVQLIQLAGVSAVFAVIIYIAHVYDESPATFGVFIRNSIRKNGWIILAAFFILWMLLSFLINKKYENYKSFADAMFGAVGRNEGIIIRSMEMLLAIGLAFVHSSRKKKRVIHGILAVSVILAIPVLAQEWRGLADFLRLSKNSAFLYMTENGLHNSIFNHLNHYGYFLCMIILLAAALAINEEKNKSFFAYLFLLVLNTVVLVINNTFGSWLASLVAIFVMIILLGVSRGRKKIIRGSFVLVLFLVVSTLCSNHGDSVWAQMIGLSSDVKSVAESAEGAGEAGSGRWGVWVICAEYIQEKPAFGGCEDCLISVYQKKGYEHLTRPANEYLQYAAFYGIPALLLYIGMLVWILVNRLRQIDFLPDMVLVTGGAVFAYEVSALFGNTAIYTTMDFFVLIGFAAESINEYKKTKKQI